jgi:hypothetical protein
MVRGLLEYTAVPSGKRLTCWAFARNIYGAHFLVPSKRHQGACAVGSTRAVCTASTEVAPALRLVCMRIHGFVKSLSLLDVSGPSACAWVCGTCA